jgi:hypothetical protein
MYLGEIDPPLPASNVTGAAGMYGAPEVPSALDVLGLTLCPLFCVQEHVWMVAGYSVWGMETCLGRFWTCLEGRGGCAGRICAVGVRVLSLLVVGSLVRSSEGCNKNNTIQTSQIARPIRKAAHFLSLAE